jgi:hypothetical protein
MYRRYRSIYAIGIIHAMLGLTIFLVTPDSLLHHMRVGLAISSTRSLCGADTLVRFR